jgi:hypothetical protein
VDAVHGPESVPHALCAKLGVKVTPYVAANMLASS